MLNLFNPPLILVFVYLTQFSINFSLEENVMQQIFKEYEKNDVFILMI